MAAPSNPPLSYDILKSRQGELHGLWKHMNERLDRGLAIYAAIVTAVAAAIAASYKADMGALVLSIEVFFLSLLLALGGTFLLNFLMACTLAKTEYALGLLFIDEAMKKALDGDGDTLSCIYTPLPFPPFEDQTELLKYLKYKQVSHTPQQKEKYTKEIKERLRPMLVSSSVRMMRVWNSILFGVAAGVALLLYYYSDLPNSEPTAIIVITVFFVAASCWFFAYFTFTPGIDHHIRLNIPAIIWSVFLGMVVGAWFLSDYLYLAYILGFVSLLVAAMWHIKSNFSSRLRWIIDERSRATVIVGGICTTIVGVSSYSLPTNWIDADWRLVLYVVTLAFLLSMTLFFYFTRNRADRGLSSIIRKLDSMSARKQV